MYIWTATFCIMKSSICHTCKNSASFQTPMDSDFLYTQKSSICHTCNNLSIISDTYGHRKLLSIGVWNDAEFLHVWQMEDFCVCRKSLSIGVWNDAEVIHVWQMEDFCVYRKSTATFCIHRNLPFVIHVITSASFQTPMDSEFLYTQKSSICHTCNNSDVWQMEDFIIQKVAVHIYM
jgi:hypothetical protein